MRFMTGLTGPQLSHTQEVAADPAPADTHYENTAYLPIPQGTDALTLPP
jgi:hypothetical protein